MTTPDPRWLCEITVNGHRCTEPATSGGLCPTHHARPPRRWRLTATGPDGTTVHDSRLDNDSDLNDAMRALESRPDWTRGHHIRVSPL